MAGGTNKRPATRRQQLEADIGELARRRNEIVQELARLLILDAVIETRANDKLEELAELMKATP